MLFLRKTKPPGIGLDGFGDKEEARLLELGFLVDDMLAHNRIKFLDFHLFRHGAFVFGGGVEVTRASSRFQFNFVAHDIEPLTQC